MAGLHPKVAETTSVLTTEGPNEYGAALGSALGILAAAGDKAAVQKLIQSAIANGQSQALIAAFYTGYGTGKIIEKYIPNWDYPQEAFDTYNKASKMFDDAKSWVILATESALDPTEKNTGEATSERIEKESEKSRHNSKAAEGRPNAEQLVNGADPKADVTLTGAGRSGENVKDLKGPPNSAVKGANGRIYITNELGEVVMDITEKRVKHVNPGGGFIDGKREPTLKERDLLNSIWKK